MDDLKSLTPEEFNSLSVEEPEASEPEKTGEESTPEKTEETTPVKKEEEQRVPYSRFEEVNSELKSVKAEVDALKATKSERPLTTQEQEQLEAKNYLKNMLQEVIKEREAEKAKEEARALEEYKANVKKLSEVYKDFEEDKVVKFANKHDLKDLETAYWRMKAEIKTTPATPKPKIPSASITSEKISKEPLDTKNMDLFQVAQAAKAKLGLK